MVHLDAVRYISKLHFADSKSSIGIMKSWI
jgi:hypothetical protein